MKSAAALFMMGVAFAWTPDVAQAQFPSKPIRIVAATTAGGQPDSLARMIGQKLSESWGRPVIIDNRPGGGGLLAGGTVAKAAPDGHTLLYVLPIFTTGAVLQASLPYDPVKDFVGIIQIGYSTNVLIVSPSLGPRSVKDFIALAKTQPGKLIHASGATGTAGHLAGARLNVIAGIKAVHVAFKGGPDATLEILAGRAHYQVSTLGVALPFIKEGKLVALAVVSPQRTPVLPDVPALAESMSEFKQPDTSHGLLAPAGTPRAIVNQINKEIARILDLPDIRERFQSIGFVVAPTTPEEYDRIVRAQIQTMSKLVVDAGLKAK